MNRRKYNGLIIVSFVLLLVWALSGTILLNLETTDSTVVSEPVRKIKVLIRTGTESAALRQLLAPFEHDTGIRVEFIEIGRDGYFTAVGTQLLAGSNTFDIVFVPNTSIAQFASAKAIAPLDGYISSEQSSDPEGFDLDDFLTVYRYKGSIYALPTDISTHFLYYRSDLIPNPPDTWEEVYEIAKKFSQFGNPKSPTIWGLAMPGVVPEERTKIFASLLWSFGGNFLEEDSGKVLLDSEASVRAGDYLQRLVRDKIVPDKLLSWDFVRTRDALLSGEVAMAAPYWNSAYPTIKLNAGPYAGFIRIALLPGRKDSDGTVQRVPFQHGWTLAINANSDNKEAAWKFLAYATGKRGGMIYADAGGVPARRSLLGDPAFREKRPDFSLILETMKMAENEPSVTYYPAMVDAVERALAKVVTLYEEPQDAFREASTDLRRLAVRAAP
ncbi:sugar ABC transporter substrate-binding protein [Paenibacillus oryzisoli]|uniref:ABC transporter substrate-binding protein n=1 Tax=Paenibacillus oryzisoli TaxID=1850517 RepID=UPI003D2CBD1E